MKNFMQNGAANAAKPNKKTVLGRRAKGAALAGMVFLSPLATTGCPTPETEYITEYLPGEEVPTYPEITIKFPILDTMIDVQAESNLFAKKCGVYENGNDITVSERLSEVFAMAQGDSNSGKDRIRLACDNGAKIEILAGLKEKCGYLVDDLDIDNLIIKVDVQVIDKNPLIIYSHIIGNLISMVERKGLVMLENQSGQRLADGSKPFLPQDMNWNKYIKANNRNDDAGSAAPRICLASGKPGCAAQSG
jgi:hypothetical protein